MVRKIKEEIRKAQEKVVQEKKKISGKEGKTKQNQNYGEKKESLPSIKTSLEHLNFEEEDSSVQEEPKLEIKELKSLEETLSKEKIPKFVRDSEYTQELSREPVQALYDQAKELIARGEEKGYFNQTEQRQIEYITGAIEEKVEGEYSFTEETAKKASLILQLASESKNLYKGHGSNQKSWYKSG